MKKYYDLIVVMPIGPRSDIDFIKDTIDSLAHYTSCSYKLILADDSQEGTGPAVKELFPAADVLCTVKPMGGWAGLYITLAWAYRHALENYGFRLLLKLDTDALVVGYEPQREAFDLFERDERMGIAGQYPFEYSGKAWDIGWPRDRVLNGATTWRYIKRPIANYAMRRLYLQAVQHGYLAGESVFGGAYFMSRSLLSSLYEKQLLPNLVLGRLNMGEDHLFALLARSAGFKLGDLSSGQLPFGCAWKGLPASPEELSARGKKIIHSTRFWENMNEQSIRAYFKAKRAAHAINKAIL
ncbi:MAG TPA: hypothetical protein VD996_13200 [Chitinophagaceae bacterium]|nr:hypothetical protein [Chitinophagaceae bacterium]